MNAFFLGVMAAVSVNISVPCVVTPFIASPPDIDGRLDDSVWQAAPVLDRFDVEGSTTPAPLRTEIRLLCDGTYLYAGFWCEEPAINKVREAMDSFDKPSWESDLVEMQFDIPHGETRYREFMVNANGLGTVGYELDKEAVKRFRSAAVYGKSAWTAECALPLKAYGIEQLRTQVVWGVNIRRLRTYFDATQTENYQWTGNPYGFNDTTRYGELVIGPKTGLVVDSFRLGETRIGPNNPVPTRFTNCDRSRRVLIRACSEEGNTTSETRFRLRKGTNDCVANLTLAAHPNKQRVTLSILEEKSGDVLYSRIDYAHLPLPLEVRITEPAYRGLLTPADGALRGEIVLGMSPPLLKGAKLNLTVVRDARIQATKRLRVRDPHVSFLLDASQFGNGKNELLVSAVDRDGNTLGSKTLSIYKASSGSLPSIHSRIDGHLNLVVEGKPFFPLGWYSGHSTDHLREIAASGVFNCILDYGMNHMSFEEIEKYLNLADKLGIKIIYCCNDLYPGATYIPRKEVWRGNREIAEATIRAFRDHPAIIAWYLNDELPLSMLNDLFDYYSLFRELAPNQPTLLVHYQTGFLKPMARTADILGLDKYPVPQHPLTSVSDFVDLGYTAVDGGKPLWMVLQAFGWYQYKKPKHPVEGNPRARIPDESELLTGRAPTRNEVRCMTYLALTHNAKAILYYCYYDMRVLPQYQEMWAWMQEIGAEVKTLFPVLLSSNTLPTHCKDSRIHHLARKTEDGITLLAVNGAPEGGPATISVDAPITGHAAVLFENRTVDARDGKLTDTFGPLEAHVYRLR